MRRVICVLLASLMFFGGLAVLIHQLTVASDVIDNLISAAIMLIAVGGVWLFEDFVRPLFGMKSED